MKHIISFLLVCVCFFSLLPITANGIQNKLDRILNAEFYFHRELSGIEGYRFLNMSEPSWEPDYTLSSYFQIGVYELLNGWISPPVPRDYNLTKDFVFTFSLHVQGRANSAKIFFRFYAYRNDNEIFLFQSVESPYIPNVQYNLLWQHELGNHTVSVKDGDRLVLRLFLDVERAGTFGFGYDCVNYPSWVNDPTEVLLDGYTFTINYVQVINKVHPSSTSDMSSIGQDFHHTRSGNAYLTSAKFRLTRFGSPNGYLKGACYASDTPSSPKGKPTGSPLAISTNSISMMSIALNSNPRPPQYTVVTFTFDGTYELVPNTYYVIQCYAYSGTNLDYTNYIGTTYITIGSDNGRWSNYRFSAWYSGVLDQDTYFQVWGEDVPSAQWNFVEMWSGILLTRAWDLVEMWNGSFITRAWKFVEEWSGAFLTRTWNLIETWIGEFLGAGGLGWLIIPIIFLGILVAVCVVIAYSRGRDD